METLAEVDPTKDADRRHGHEVVVLVDGTKKQVKSGDYVVAQFKAIVGVPEDRELNIVEEGKLHPLDDKSTITIKGHEVFVSSPRGGGSS